MKCLSNNAYHLHLLFSSTFLLDYRNRLLSKLQDIDFLLRVTDGVGTVFERAKILGLYLDLSIYSKYAIFLRFRQIGNSMGKIASRPQGYAYVRCIAEECN